MTATIEHPSIAEEHVSCLQRARQEWQQAIVFYPPDIKREWQDRPLSEIVSEGISVLRYSQYYQAKEAMNVIYVDGRGNSVLLKSVLSRPVGSKASDWKIEQ
jgi:hypothetical protein